MPRDIEDVVIWCDNDDDLSKPVGRAANIAFDVDSTGISLQVTNGPIVAIQMQSNGTLQIEIHDMGSNTPVIRTETGGINEIVQIWPIVPSA